MLFIKVLGTNFNFYKLNDFFVSRPNWDLQQTWFSGKKIHLPPVILSSIPLNQVSFADGVMIWHEKCFLIRFGDLGSVFFFPNRNRAHMTSMKQCFCCNVDAFIATWCCITNAWHCMGNQSLLPFQNPSYPIKKRFWSRFLGAQGGHFKIFIKNTAGEPKTWGCPQHLEMFQEFASSFVWMFAANLEIKPRWNQTIFDKWMQRSLYPPVRLA